MKLAVAGAGAVGCHYGSLLQQAGADVVFLARGSHLDAIRQSGLRHSSLEWERQLQLEASDDPAIVGGCDVILLSCKTTGLEQMCRQLAGHVADEAMLVTLQNGVQAPDLVGEMFPGHSIVAGSAFIGARIETAGHVVHSAAGHIRLGLWRQGQAGDVQSGLNDLLGMFSDAGVDAKIVRDVRQLLWNKLLWNCGFNAITALTRRYARDVAKDAETAAMALAAMREAGALAARLGVTLSEEAADKQLEITKGVGTVKTSMWQDIEQGRPTEIDALNGYVADRAGEVGLEAPVNRMLTALVKALECRSGND